LYSVIRLLSRFNWFNVSALCASRSRCCWSSQGCTPLERPEARARERFRPLRLSERQRALLSLLVELHAVGQRILHFAQRTVELLTVTIQPG
jgi:hypothetical protein